MARSGMAALLEELRGMCEAGTSEYTVGTTVYWTDDALQNILDIHRRDFRFTPTEPRPDIVQGGTLQYFEYRAPVGYFEQTTGGSAIFYVQDSTGATIGTSLWSADYRRGILTFVNDAKGTSFYVTGRSYDLNAAAAEVWRKKAAHYAPTSFDFSTDNHSIKREQVYSHAVEQAAFFAGMSGDAIQTADRYRSDLYACD